MTNTDTTRVRCPACKGAYLYDSRQPGKKKCLLCHGSGTLDPDEWNSCNDPARMVAMLPLEKLPADRKQAFILACRKSFNPNSVEEEFYSGVDNLFRYWCASRTSGDGTNALR